MTASGETEAWWSRIHEGTILTKTPNAHSGPAVMDGSLVPWGQGPVESGI